MPILFINYYKPMTILIYINRIIYEPILHNYKLIEYTKAITLHLDVTRIPVFQNK